MAAKAFGSRPSDLLHVRDRYAAYCLDNACAEFGQAVEAALSKVKGKNDKEIAVKTERELLKWLDRPMRYREPSVAQSRKG